MKILSILFILILNSFAIASSPTTSPKKEPDKKKSSFNTNIYEQDSVVQTFSAVVKVVREVQGEFQVFFEGRPGFYGLREVALQHKLAKSLEQKKPVSVEVDSDSRQILSVEFKE